MLKLLALASIFTLLAACAHDDVNVKESRPSAPKVPETKQAEADRLSDELVNMGRVDGDWDAVDLQTYITKAERWLELDGQLPGAGSFFDWGRISTLKKEVAFAQLLLQFPDDKNVRTDKPITLAESDEVIGETQTLLNEIASAGPVNWGWSDVKLKDINDKICGVFENSRRLQRLPADPKRLEIVELVGLLDGLRGNVQHFLDLRSGIYFRAQGSL